MRSGGVLQKGKKLRERVWTRELLLQLEAVISWFDSWNDFRLLGCMGCPPVDSLIQKEPRSLLVSLNQFNRALVMENKKFFLFLKPVELEFVMICILIPMEHKEGNPQVLMEIIFRICISGLVRKVWQNSPEDKLLLACLVKIRRMVLSSRSYDTNCKKVLSVFWVIECYLLK